MTSGSELLIQAIGELLKVAPRSPGKAEALMSIEEALVKCRELEAYYDAAMEENRQLKEAEKS